MLLTETTPGITAIHPSIALLDTPSYGASTARLEAVWLPLSTSIDVWWVDPAEDDDGCDARLCAMEHCLNVPPHPSIVAVRASGYTDRGHHWVATDRPPNPSLASSPDTIDHGTLIARARRLFQALVHLESHNIVHGDIGPSAIAIDPSTGEALLGRFGVATHDTSTGTARFPAPAEPEFASPERMAESALSSSADIYSLALTLYATFRACSAAEARMELVKETSPLPEFVRELFERLTSPAPRDRPKTARRALAELELVSTECEDETPQREASRSDAWRQRWPQRD